MTVPTPDDIDDVIEDMLAGEPHDKDEPMWDALAYDPQGELQGVGYGYSLAEARALAWICACGWEGQLGFDWYGVPRIVPDGWYFWPPDESLN
jgi:hypothetical protein